MRKENDPLQAPVSREIFQEWLNQEEYPYYSLDVRQDNGEVWEFRMHDILPEVCVFSDVSGTAYGLYDKKAQDIRFVNRAMSACVDGLSDAELPGHAARDTDFLQFVKNYGQNAVEQGGYQVDPMALDYHHMRQTVFAGLDAMTSYAGVLAAKGEENAALDLRDLAFDMQTFWQDHIYWQFPKAKDEQVQQYHRKFDDAVQAARETSGVPRFDDQMAGAVLDALSLHADEALFVDEDHFAVWQCSQFAKRLQEEHPDVETDFGQQFPADHSERFLQFGCDDSDHLCTGWLFNREVLLFRDPIPEDAVPEDWYCYHLAGRNIRNADKLLASVPESVYVGTVLTPYRLMDGEQKDILPKELRVGMLRNQEFLTHFCEKHCLPEPDMGGIFPDQKQVAGMGGMSL